MTGRAAGYCTGHGAPGFAGGGWGRGMGGGRGGGRGFGRGFGRGWGWPAVGAAAPTGDQELTVLQQQAKQLQADMDLIRSRIQELESKPTKSE